MGGGILSYAPTLPPPPPTHPSLLSLNTIPELLDSAIVWNAMPHWFANVFFFVNMCIISVCYLICQPMLGTAWCLVSTLSHDPYPLPELKAKKEEEEDDMRKWRNKFKKNVSGN